MPTLPEDQRPRFMRRAAGSLSRLAPGVVLCGGVTLFALAVQALEERALDHPYVEAIVIAILVGTCIRTIWEPGSKWRPGIAFSAKQLLEIAVACLGASITFSSIVASGGLLISSIVAVVIATLVASFGIGRALGLSKRLAFLIACGNSICGNSAIAAVAPVIGATRDEIASSISFTAILGVVVVLGLPILIPLLGLSASQYGVLAGMTVYAVPQVLAATVPAGIVSTQIGTVVKLVRVMMLGPLVAITSVAIRGLRNRSSMEAAADRSMFTFIPWFILAFLVLAALRSLSLVPVWVILPLQKIAMILTVWSMAALGLGVDLKVLSRIGGRVTAAVTLSLLFLLLLSLVLVKAIGNI